MESAERETYTEPTLEQREVLRDVVEGSAQTTSGAIG